jgi:pSer/pThr/pTyr-binding forkhead associated (FHA) protein
VPSLVPQGAHDGKRPMTLNRLFTLIGSAPSARLYLPSKAVSRCHAVIINADTGFYVRDLASRTQVVVNGRPVREADLRDGDVLQVGPFTFRFTDPGGRSRPVPVPPPVALLEAEGLSEPLRLEDRLVLIGRRETADVSLTENSASSAHAVLIATNGGHVVRDLNSRTGTFVNDAKIHEQVLQPGDTLRVGETTMRYARARNQAVTVPAVPAVPAAVPPAAPAKPTPAAAKREPAQKSEPDPEPEPEPAADFAGAVARAAETETAPRAEALRGDPGSNGKKESAPAAPAAVAPTPNSADDASADTGSGADLRITGSPESDDAAPALAESAEGPGDGSSLGVGAYLDSLTGTTDARPDGHGAHPEASDVHSPAEPGAGEPDAGTPAGPDRAGEQHDETIPSASSDEVFEDVPARAESWDGVTPGTAAGAVDPSSAAPSPAEPSPALPSPAPPSFALVGAASDVPDLEDSADDGDEIPELAKPDALSEPDLARPAPPVPPLPLPPRGASAAPAALPARPAWGNRARSPAPPGSSASPREAGGAAGGGWANRPAAPAPPAPPPSALPGRRAAGAKPPPAPRNSKKPANPPAPRTDRPSSPFDLAPGNGAELLEELLPEPPDPAPDAGRQRPG